MHALSMTTHIFVCSPINVGLDKINPVFGKFNQARFKPVCSATETSKNIETLHVARLTIVLSIE